MTRKKIMSLLSSLMAIIIVSVFCIVMKNSLAKCSQIILVTILLFLAYYLLVKHGNERLLFYCMFSMMIVCQLFLGYFLMVQYDTWDVSAVTKNAAALATGNNINTIYFARYPNNIAILLLFSIVFKITYFLFDSTSIYFLVVLNILAIDLSIILSMKVIEILFSSQVAYRTGICMTLFAPFYLYVPITYTDTFSLPFVAGIIYMFISLEKMSEKKKIITLTGIGVLLLIGYKLKGSIIIIMVACLMYLLFKKPLKIFLKYTTIIVLGFIISSTFWTSVSSNSILITEEQYNLHQFPVTHWIMMGLNGMGNYNADDVEYTVSFENYDDKREATVKIIKERIMEKGIVGVGQHFFAKATNYAWNYGTCYAERYLGDFGDQPLRKNILHEFALSNGTYHFITYLFTQSIFLIFFGFAAWSYVVNIKHGSLETFFLQLIIFGCMLFFMIWETHPRYILNYTIVLIMLAVPQIDLLCNNILDKIIRK